MSQSAIKTFYYSKWFIIVCILLIVFFGYSTVKDYYRQQDLRTEIEKYNDQIQSLGEKQEDLKKTLDYVQSEDFIEIEARTKLNLRKPGENVIIVSNQEDINKLNISKSLDLNNDKQEKESNHKAWWDYFFAW